MTGAVPMLNIGVLVFREGLESILVLAAIMASLVGPSERHRRPILVGTALAFGATLLTWQVAIRLIDDLAQSVPALQVQAATGLLAVCVLLVVMNWFFHKVYWTGWIALHTERRRQLIGSEGTARTTGTRLFVGLALLGFTSLYREGVEVVLFLQSYRLRLGSHAVMPGLYLGLALTAATAALTFVVHRRLPYRKMLVVTGVMLGVVLLVMVGEQAQEMQLAHWLPSTQIPWLAARLPSWAGLWFSVFPNVETLGAQAMALVLVLGSYIVARSHSDPAGPRRRARGRISGRIGSHGDQTHRADARGRPRDARRSGRADRDPSRVHRDLHGPRQSGRVRIPVQRGDRRAHAGRPGRQDAEPKLSRG